MLRVSDIMTTRVVTVSPELGLRDAMELFVSEHISGAPVVEGRRVVGVVSATDLMGLAASLPGSPTERRDEGAALRPVQRFEPGDSSRHCIPLRITPLDVARCAFDGEPRLCRCAPMAGYLRQAPV